MRNKILLAVDGSANSKRSAEYVVSLLERCRDTEVTIIYVIPKYLPDPDVGSNQPSDSAVELANKVIKFTEEILSSSGSSIKTVIKHGGIAKEITDYAKQENFELIVMGSRGLSSVEGITLGSVSHNVLALSDIPVLFVK